MTQPRRILAFLGVTLVTFSACLAVAGCDPVHEQKMSALGGEAPGVPKGPTHRPGQPCLVCHGSQGPESPQFSVAGTVYRHLEGKEPSVDTRVRVVDAFGRDRTVITNQVGTFYIYASE